VFCTEFGPDITVGSPTAVQRQQFETDMFAMFKPRQIGWAIWHYMGGNGPDYTAAWTPAVLDGSPIPKAGNSAIMTNAPSCVSHAAKANGKVYGVSGKLCADQASLKKEDAKRYGRLMKPDGAAVDLQR
jgi:hypothetical protein